MKELFLLDRNRSCIFKKYKIYVDISIDEDSNFEISQKLNSFFGQIGVYEGHDRIISYFDWLFKLNKTNFYLYKEKVDFESFDSDLEEFSNEGVYLTFNNFENITDEIDPYNFFFDSNDEKVMENDQVDNLEEEKMIMYVPIYIIFYFGEKKVDFLFLNSFKKKYYFDRQRYINCLNFIKFKEDFYIFKISFFNKIKMYNYLLSFIWKTFKRSNNFFNIFNLTSLDFFKPDNFLNSFTKQFIEFFNLKRSRLFIFKKILNKKNISVFYNLKKSKWFDTEILLSLFIYKHQWFVNKFKHKDLLDSQVYFLSQLNFIKKKFLKKFKRKRRYKKNITRNFFGIKNFYEKVYNIIEEKKKKKRR